MFTKKDFWEYKIVDALPPAKELHSFAVGKLEENGPNVMVTGGFGGLFLYYGKQHERITIDKDRFFHVGLALEDIDGDGVCEIIVAEEVLSADIAGIAYDDINIKDYRTNHFKIIAYKMGETITDPWTRCELDSNCMGNPYDIYFSDIDGDGENEMIAVAAYSVTPGLYLYKKGKAYNENWNRFPIMEGHLTEGIAIADLNGDGRPEIVSGPDWYVMPEDGLYAGIWTRGVYAPTNRDMCRMNLMDITGNGKLDIVSVESEYLEGRFCWYENCIEEDPDNPWKEHFIDEGFIFAHSIKAWVDEKTGENKVFIAEMCEGGWKQPYNWDARLLIYTVSNNGATWTQNEVYHGAGTHQTTLYDIDNDGELEIVGKTWQHPVVQIWKEKKPSKILNFKHSFVDRDKPNTAIDIFAVDVDGDGVEDIVCGAWWY